MKIARYIIKILCRVGGADKKSRKKTGRLTVFPLTCNKPKEVLVFRIKQETIKGRRPSVPRCVKCQYVVNMSITCMLKKAIREDDKFPPTTPPQILKAPPLIKHSMGLFKKPGALKTHIINILSLFKFLIDTSCLTGTWLSNTGTKTVYQTVKRDRIQNSDHLHSVGYVIQSTF